MLSGVNTHVTNAIAPPGLWLPSVLMSSCVYECLMDSNDEGFI